MRHTVKFPLAFCVIALFSANAQAAFIQPVSASTTATFSTNTPAVLINAATGGGGTSYVAPNANSGGGGTSWHTGDAGTTPVAIDFDFASATDFVSELYLWDYYSHSPSQWTLKLYTGAGGTGTELLDYDFAIVPGPNPTSTLHVIDVTDVTGALSGILETRNNSASGGVGLSEFGFVTFAPPPPPAPEPSSLLLLAGGLLWLRSSKKRASAVQAY